MANVRIIIDNITVMDANITLTTGDLPNMNELRQKLQTTAGHTFQPWQLPTVGALSAVLLEANAKGVIPDTTITVTTATNGWNLDVEHAT